MVQKSALTYKAARAAVASKAVLGPDHRSMQSRQAPRRRGWLTRERRTSTWSHSNRPQPRGRRQHGWPFRKKKRGLVAALTRPPWGEVEERWPAIIGGAGQSAC